MHPILYLSANKIAKLVVHKSTTDAAIYIYEPNGVAVSLSLSLGFLNLPRGTGVSYSMGFL